MSVQLYMSVLADEEGNVLELFLKNFSFENGRLEEITIIIFFCLNTFH